MTTSPAAGRSNVCVFVAKEPDWSHGRVRLTSRRNNQSAPTQLMFTSTNQTLDWLMDGGGAAGVISHSASTSSGFLPVTWAAEDRVSASGLTIAQTLTLRPVGWIKTDELSAVLPLVETSERWIGAAQDLQKRRDEDSLVDLCLISLRDSDKDTDRASGLVFRADNDDELKLNWKDF